MRKLALLALGVMVLTTAFAGAAMAQYSPPPAPATQPAPTPAPATQPAPTPAPATQPAPAPAPATQPAPAPAPATQGQYPNVANLKPFSAEADYMSLAGYLRYLVFQQANQWLTRQEAVRIVNQQRGM